MMKIEVIADENIATFKEELNNFLATIPVENIISIQYSTTPTAISTHTEYGVYPSVEYSALIQFKG